MGNALSESCRMSRSHSHIDAFHREMRDFREFGKSTIMMGKKHGAKALPVYINEFWTAKQRAAHSLHEVSYRACFKPQLPRFFVERFTVPGEQVYDPFMGRGTTLIESALLGRTPIGCDINPLSAILCLPRLRPIDPSHIIKRLLEIDLSNAQEIREDLLAFYHPDTLRELCALREYFFQREQQGLLDKVDNWIRMVATNRLTGHSPGFFSVYTLPPNQTVSIGSQLRINEKRQQVPPRRDIRDIIVKKSKSLIKDLNELDRKKLQRISKLAACHTASCTNTPAIPNECVALVVTSPPFLDIVQYDQDNWLRCWFNGVDSRAVPIWQLRTEEAWQHAMSSVFVELERILLKGGVVAFEVGEVRKGSVLLEDLVLPAAEASGLEPFAILINDQNFTKTSNCWGIDNVRKGTNTNRIILLQKASPCEQLTLL